jgi:hypothetical protein
LALGRVAGATCQQRQPLLEPFEDLSRRQGFHPRRRQFERKR